MKKDVITLTISKELINRIDNVRGPEARASYIRRAVVAALEVDITKQKARFSEQPVDDGSACPELDNALDAETAIRDLEDAQEPANV
jgi:hypothetical protein